MDLWLLDTPLCVRVDDSPCLWAPCGLMCGVTGRFTCKLPWMSPHFLTCEMVVLLPTVGLKWEDAWFRAVLTGKHSNNELLLQLPLLLDRTCLKAGDGKCVCVGGVCLSPPTDITSAHPQNILASGPEDPDFSGWGNRLREVLGWDNRDGPGVGTSSLLLQT